MHVQLEKLRVCHELAEKHDILINFYTFQRNKNFRLFDELPGKINQMN